MSDLVVGIFKGMCSIDIFLLVISYWLDDYDIYEYNEV